jgi:hypothetical protein
VKTTLWEALGHKVLALIMAYLGWDEYYMNPIGWWASLLAPKVLKIKSMGRDILGLVGEFLGKYVWDRPQRWLLQYDNPPPPPIYIVGEEALALIMEFVGDTPRNHAIKALFYYGARDVWYRFQSWHYYTYTPNDNEWCCACGKFSEYWTWWDETKVRYVYLQGAYGDLWVEGPTCSRECFMWMMVDRIEDFVGGSRINYRALL